MSDLGIPNDANALPGKTKNIEPAKFDDVYRQLSGPPLVRIAYNGEGGEQTTGAPPKRRTELAQNTPQGTDQHKYFSTTEPDPDEVRFAGHGLDAFKDKAQGYKQVKEFINQNGRDPSAAVVDAIKNTNMVGLGELHEDTPPNPPRNWAAAHMRDFARAGTTDLFVEMPKVLQPVIDKFNNDPKKGPFQIPDKIIGPDGKPIDTPVAKGALEMLREFQQSDPDFFKMWAAAREAGIKVHAVDNDANGLLYFNRNPDDPDVKRLTAQRKQDMAANMLGILDQPTKPGEPPRKGIAWMGNVDIADGPGYQGTPSLKIVKDALAKKGERTASFFTQNAESNGDAQWSIFPLAATVNRPVAAPTHEPDGKPNLLGRMTTLRGYALPYNYDNWDQIILFPPTNK
jgi:hypothetical protein